MSEQSPYDASAGGLPRLAGSSKRRTEERLRYVEADRDRLAAELEAERTMRRIECEMSEACCQCQGLRTELSFERARIAALRMEMSGRSFAQQEAEALRAELSAARADAERVEYCVRNALALDFAYGEDGRCAVVIEIPKDARYSVGFRDIIDTARAASSARRALDQLHQMDHEDSAGGPQT